VLDGGVETAGKVKLWVDECRVLGIPGIEKTVVELLPNRLNGGWLRVEEDLRRRSSKFGFGKLESYV
jgi:hypothetical protein